jgi:hypothetical protein
VDRPPLLRGAPGLPVLPPAVRHPEEAVSARVPVLILLDFERSIVARYVGSKRTLRCAPTEDSALMRAWTWTEALHTIRYTPDALYLPKEEA